jgi:hypothetical protein
MRTGRPLVATNLLTHTQVLDTTVAELVQPSPRGLLNGLLKVLLDAEVGRALADAARQRADERYSDSVYLQRVETFYAKVMRAAASKAKQLPS